MTNREKLIKENPILNGEVSAKDIARVKGKAVLCSSVSNCEEECDFGHVISPTQCEKLCEAWLNQEAD